MDREGRALSGSIGDASRHAQGDRRSELRQAAERPIAADPLGSFPHPAQPEVPSPALLEESLINPHAIVDDPKREIACMLESDHRVASAGMRERIASQPIR